MFDRLRYFVAVVDAGTFSAGARRAGISQPALTAAIAKLEDEVSARLFVRGHSGVSLTAEGAALLPRARAALAAVEDGRRAVREIAGLEAGEVRIGGGATACMYFLPPVLAEFRKAHPKVRLTLREGTSEGLLSALESGALDLAITTTDRGDPWFEDDLVLVRAPSLDPKDAPFVTFPVGGSTREMLELHFPGVPIAMEIGSIAAIVAHASEGIGVALVSRHAVKREIAEKKLVRIPDSRTPIPRRFHVVHHGVERLPPAAAALRELLLSPRAVRAVRRGLDT
ncbi:MAG TPA: LysR family transcriptional regulator [Polyangiaceae bacterium]|nr:LysR family transcriptional regulator [Polyangiaceae bacterium]